MARIGAHDREGEPLTVATATGSEVIQFFLGDPQGWGAPTFPGGDAGKLRAALNEAGLEVFIHAPYGINVASANNRIRIPSRKLLSQQLAAAAGDHAMARGLPALRRLWEAIGDLSEDDGTGAGQIGFCLDTCHAYASGEDLAGIVDRVKAITGRIDLVHCNNSRDEFGSSRDRHANLESGTIDPALLVAVVQAAGAPVICETPDAPADVRWLRAQLGS